MSLSALVSEIFKETGWGRAVLPPPPNATRVRCFPISRKTVKFQISASKTTLFRGKEQMLPGSGTYVTANALCCYIGKKLSFYKIIKNVFSKEHPSHFFSSQDKCSNFKMQSTNKVFLGTGV